MEANLRARSIVHRAETQFGASRATTILRTYLQGTTHIPFTGADRNAILEGLTRVLSAPTSAEMGAREAHVTGALDHLNTQLPATPLPSSGGAPPWLVPTPPPPTTGQLLAQEVADTFGDKALEIVGRLADNPGMTAHDIPGYLDGLAASHGPQGTRAIIQKMGFAVRMVDDLMAKGQEEVLASTLDRYQIPGSSYQNRMLNVLLGDQSLQANIIHEVSSQSSHLQTIRAMTGNPAMNLADMYGFVQTHTLPSMARGPAQTLENITVAEVSTNQIMSLGGASVLSAQLTATGVPGHPSLSFRVFQYLQNGGSIDALMGSTQTQMIAEGVVDAAASADENPFDAGHDHIIGLDYKISDSGVITDIKTTKAKGESGPVRPDGKHAGGKDGRHTSPYALTQGLVWAAIQGQTVPEAIDRMRGLIQGLITLPGGTDCFEAIHDASRAMSPHGDVETLRVLVNAFFEVSDTLPFTAFELNSRAPGHGESGLSREFAEAAQGGPVSLDALLSRRAPGSLFDAINDSETLDSVAKIMAHNIQAKLKGIGKRGDVDALSLSAGFASKSHGVFAAKAPGQSFGIDFGSESTFRSALSSSHGAMSAELITALRDLNPVVGNPEMDTALGDERTLVLFTGLPISIQREIPFFAASSAGLGRGQLATSAQIRAEIEKQFSAHTGLSLDNLDTAYAQVRGELSRMPGLLDSYRASSWERHEGRLDALRGIAEGVFDDPSAAFMRQLEVARGQAATHLASPDHVAAEWTRVTGGSSVLEPVDLPGARQDCLINGLFQGLGIDDADGSRAAAVRAHLNIPPGVQLYADTVPQLLSAIQSLGLADTSQTTVVIHALQARVHEDSATFDVVPHFNHQVFTQGAPGVPIQLLLAASMVHQPETGGYDQVGHFYSLQPKS